MNRIIWVAVLVAAVVLGIWYFAGQTQAPQGNVAGEGAGAPEENRENLGENTITFTDEGFSPSVLTVKRGDTVTFMNGSGNAFWPASAIHPTHTVYPGSGIEKCDTDLRGSLFDACEGIDAGGTWSFTFNEVGEWGYHDHLNTQFFGKVVVE